MALRTPLDEVEARAVCDAYGLALESFEPLPALGTVNSNFRVRASGRVWFLRLNEGKRDADVAGEVALVDRLRAHGLPTPEIMRARELRRFLHHLLRFADDRLVAGMLLGELVEHGRRDLLPVR